MKAFLEKRRDIAFEICTRAYEEERKKAEDELEKVKKLRLMNPPGILNLSFPGKREHYECKHQGNAYKCL